MFVLSPKQYLHEDSKSITPGPGGGAGPIGLPPDVEQPRAAPRLQRANVRGARKEGADCDHEPRGVE